MFALLTGLDLPPPQVPTRPPGGCRIRGERVGKRDVALVKRRALRAHGVGRVSLSLRAEYA